MLCTVVGSDWEYQVNENGHNLVSFTGNYKNATTDLFWPSMKYSVCTCVIKSVEPLKQSCEGYTDIENV